MSAMNAKCAIMVKRVGDVKRDYEMRKKDQHSISYCYDHILDVYCNSYARDRNNCDWNKMNEMYRMRVASVGGGPKQLKTNMSSNCRLHVTECRGEFINTLFMQYDLHIYS